MPTENTANRQREKSLKVIRLMLAIVAAGLVLAGLTTFWLPWEVTRLLDVVFQRSSTAVPFFSTEYRMLLQVEKGLQYLQQNFPQFFLGTDYLGFAHIMFALLFIGAIRDPLKNLWTIQFGMIAAALVIPGAFVFGTVRGLPVMHYFIDASFGIGAIIPFYIALREAKKISRLPEPA